MGETELACVGEGRLLRRSDQALLFQPGELVRYCEIGHCLDGPFPEGAADHCRPVGNLALARGDRVEPSLEDARQRYRDLPALQGGPIRHHPAPFVTDHTLLHEHARYFLEVVGVPLCRPLDPGSHLFGYLGVAELPCKQK